MQPTRLLIVEDEPLFREMLTRTLTAEPGLEVVGEAADGESAVRLTRELEPDAVLMDIELPGDMDGIDAAERIKAERPETGIVILSAHKDRRYASSLHLGQSPGWSYILKQSVRDVAAVVRAIDGCINGMLVLDPALVESLRPRKGSALSRLTPRQQSVLALIAQGFNNAAIAQQLTLAERTVETYIYAIYQELQLTGQQDLHARVQATRLYLQESQADS